MAELTAIGLDELIQLVGSHRLPGHQFDEKEVDDAITRPLVLEASKGATTRKLLADRFEQTNRLIVIEDKSLDLESENGRRGEGMYCVRGEYSVDELAALAARYRVDLVREPASFLALRPCALLIENSREECADAGGTLAEEIVFDLVAEDGERHILGVQGWRLDLGAFGYERGDSGEWFDGRLAREARAAAIAQEAASAADPTTTVKCVVVDCDNVLWIGSAGEWSLDAIRITAPHAEFQRKLKQLAERGYLLAIVSKNEIQNVAKVFEHHAGMVLHLSDFTFVKVNWVDKPSNLREIASALNIGTDSLLFIDDDPHELGAVRALVPDVRLLAFPHSIDKIPNTIDELDRLCPWREVTDEDRQRRQFFSAHKSREAAKSHALPDEYFRSLEMVAKIRVETAGSRLAERIAQLSTRTNRMNFTRRPLTSDDVRKLLDDPRYRVYTLEVQDRYSPYGVVGMMILRETEDAWRVENFCVSCRLLITLSREDAFRLFLAHVIDDCRKRGIDRVRGVSASDAGDDDLRNLWKMAGTLEQKDWFYHPERTWLIDTRQTNISAPDWIDCSITPVGPMTV